MMGVKNGKGVERDGRGDSRGDETIKGEMEVAGDVVGDHSKTEVLVGEVII